MNISVTKVAKEWGGYQERRSIKKSMIVNYPEQLTKK